LEARLWTAGECEVDTACNDDEATEQKHAVDAADMYSDAVRIQSS
jgi:hypothetical protein